MPEHFFTYKLANAHPLEYPYRHLYVRECFPDVFYRELQDNLPDPDLLEPIGKGRGADMEKYPQRYVFAVDSGYFLGKLPYDQRVFWRNFTYWLASQRIIKALSEKFRSVLEQRFGGIPKLRPDLLLVRDEARYSLGPHTDTPSKAIACLFYLPGDSSRAHLGTSIYVPKAGTVADTAAHYKHEEFHKVATMPYLPNSMFCFTRTDNSFHGVEPVVEGTRWLLQYNLKAET